MASGTTGAKSPQHSNKVQEDHKVFASKYSAKILDNAQSGNAQIKKDNTTLKEANTAVWLAASRAYEGLPNGKGRQAHLHAILGRIDTVGLTQKRMLKAGDGQNKRGGQAVADQSCAGLEGIGAWSTHRND